MSRRHPDDRPIFIRQGWPQAMNHLPWIGDVAPCCPASSQLAPRVSAAVMSSVCPTYKHPDERGVAIKGATLNWMDYLGPSTVGFEQVPAQAGYVRKRAAQMI
jgi:hypothetical protein